jgi:hypothetical protein
MERATGLPLAPLPLTEGSLARLSASTSAYGTATPARSVVQWSCNGQAPPPLPPAARVRTPEPQPQRSSSRAAPAPPPLPPPPQQLQPVAVPHLAEPPGTPSPGSARRTAELLAQFTMNSASDGGRARPARPSSSSGGPGVQASLNLL